MEIGICTLADVGTHPITKEIVATHQRLLNLIEKLSNQFGLPYFFIGTKF
jgi:hypothetical protein